MHLSIVIHSWNVLIVDVPDNSVNAIRCHILLHDEMFHTFVLQCVYVTCQLSARRSRWFRTQIMVNTNSLCLLVLNRKHATA